LLAHGEATPRAWIADAWEIDAVRLPHFRHLERGIRRHGYIDLNEQAAALLGESLGVDRQIDLFHRLRDGFPYWEGALREQFGPIFPLSLPALPSPLSREQVDEMTRVADEVLGEIMRQFHRHFRAMVGDEVITNCGMPFPEMAPWVGAEVPRLNLDIPGTG